MVVIITTPFAALDPYIAVADASFNTDTEAISPGLRELILPVIIPSITYNGPALLNVPVPLIVITEPAPGAPPCACTLTPAILPCRA